jgi:hypothetical protein
MIIGVDYHPSFQQIAFLVEETGECGERQLNRSDGEAERFYLVLTNMYLQWCCTYSSISRSLETAPYDRARL